MDDEDDTPPSGSTLSHFKEKLLNVRKGELLEKLHYCSLERIFIEYERIYKDAEFENLKEKQAVLDHIAKRIEPYSDQFIREVTNDDLLRLLQIKMIRINRFSVKEAEEEIAALKKKIEEIDYFTSHFADFNKDISHIFIK